MENINKLIDMLDKFCEDRQDIYMGCSNCPNYNDCNKEIWDKARTKLKELENILNKKEGK
jgi:hypothetical protein